MASGADSKPAGRRAALVFAAGIAALIVSLSTMLSGQPANSAGRWVTAWSTSQQGLGNVAITDATVRMIARTTAGGPSIRIRLDNTFGRDALIIGRASVGVRARGALLAAGSSRPVTFAGNAQVTIPPGGSATSDAVALRVLAQQDLAVSLFVPGDHLLPSQHSEAAVTSYRTADGVGDVTASDSATPFTQTTTNLWWLKSIDVQADAPAAAVVAFGDSITDGTCSTLDAHDRWEDLVAVRLNLEHASRAGASPPLSVLNEGIGGNTLTRENLNPAVTSPPGLERLERDVLAHSGVSTVVLFMGTNDIRRGASASQVIQAMTTIAGRVKAKGLRAVGVTIIPRHNTPPDAATTWDSAKTRIRNEVNDWIRTRSPFDAVIDFSKVVNDPANADLLLPSFNCGDGIHPSPRGYFEMGSAVDLALLRASPKSTGSERR